MQKIRRNDEIIVIAGKDKGKRGKVQKVLADNRLVVTGINMVKRHTNLIRCPEFRAVSSKRKRR